MIIQVFIIILVLHLHTVVNLSKACSLNRSIPYCYYKVGNGTVFVVSTDLYTTVIARWETVQCLHSVF